MSRWVEDLERGLEQRCEVRHESDETLLNDLAVKATSLRRHFQTTTDAVENVRGLLDFVQSELPRENREGTAFVTGRSQFSCSRTTVSRGKVESGEVLRGSSPCGWVLISQCSTCHGDGWHETSTNEPKPGAVYKYWTCGGFSGMFLDIGSNALASSIASVLNHMKRLPELDFRLRLLPFTLFLSPGLESLFPFTHVHASFRCVERIGIFFCFFLASSTFYDIEHD